MDARQINLRASLLQKYLCDEQKELQALYALQALMVHMEQPASECPASHLGACSNVAGLNVKKVDKMTEYLKIQLPSSEGRNEDDGAHHFQVILTFFN